MFRLVGLLGNLFFENYLSITMQPIDPFSISSEVKASSEFE